MINIRRFTTLTLGILLLAADVSAQISGVSMGTTPQGSSPFLGSTPKGAATAEPVPLSLKDALTRALQFNLGLLLQEESVRAAHGARWQALADLLPNVVGTVGERRQVLNLEAFGFPANPSIVGPFNVFDARVAVSQRLFDVTATSDARAAGLREHAETLGVRTARDLVVLVTVNLYLETVTAASRIDVARAQRETAEALLRQANDLKASGLVAGIDVLRADLQVQTQRQRTIIAENDFEKAKLQLARAIGLPPGQPVMLTDKMPYTPLPPVTLDNALKEAYEKRPDYLAARDRLAAAEAEVRSAQGELLPTVSLDGDYGTIGQTIDGAHPTFTIAATVRVPIFEGGRAQGKRAEAEAEVRRRRAEFEDYRGRIDLEVRTALLDERAASQNLETARTSQTLADQELEQARDRFAAGVASNIEVTQAQESVARASEAYLLALYNHNLAKASLARAVGVAESAIMSYVGGTP